MKAVIAKSFERIHRSNLVGMRIIPLCFKHCQDVETLGLTGHERYTIHLPNDVSELRPWQDVTVTTDTGKNFTCILRFDTEVVATEFFYLSEWMKENAIRELSFLDCFSQRALKNLCFHG